MTHYHVIKIVDYDHQIDQKVQKQYNCIEGKLSQKNVVPTRFLESILRKKLQFVMTLTINVWYTSPNRDPMLIQFNFWYHVSLYYCLHKFPGNHSLWIPMPLVCLWFGDIMSRCQLYTPCHLKLSPILSHQVVYFCTSVSIYLKYFYSNLGPLWCRPHNIVATKWLCLSWCCNWNVIVWGLNYREHAVAQWYLRTNLQCL